MDGSYLMVDFRYLHFSALPNASGYRNNVEISRVLSDRLYPALVLESAGNGGVIFTRNFLSH